MRKERVKEDAVSPVIGVMLMLVVTVVIAAVVVGFSTGLAGDASRTPMALLEVEYMEMDPIVGTMLLNLGFIHKGGDEIPVKDLQIVLEVLDSNGGWYDGFVYTYNSEQITMYGQWAEIFYYMKPEIFDKNEDLMWEMMWKEIPVVSVLGQEEEINAVVSTGDVINLCLIDGNSYSSPSQFGSGFTVSWTIYHIPTNSVLADGELVVGQP